MAAVTPYVPPRPATPEPPKVDPDATYGITRVGLRIATGESGHSGLLEKLHIEKTKTNGFFIEWYHADTNTVIDYLKFGLADVGITYNAFTEKLALDDGIIDRVVYAWRTSSFLVGPIHNPAHLPEDFKLNGYVLLARLFKDIQNASKTDKPIKFLSRYDKSTLNTTESKIWAAIGQIPWAEKESSWYDEFHGSSSEALAKAMELKNDTITYTITDKKTWIEADPKALEYMRVFAEGTDDEKDPLLNPAHLLVASKSKNKELANAFADWIALPTGGQPIIKDFSIKNNTYYTLPPKGVDPLGQVTTLVNQGAPTPEAAEIARTAVRVTLSGHVDEVYFLKGNEYLRVDTVKDFVTSSNSNYITSYWGGLKEIGWDTVDAWLPIAGTSNAYGFRGDQYIDYDLTNDRILEGPAPWAKKWLTLAQAGFKKIDTALPWIMDDPNVGGSAWFFSGTKCTRIHVDHDTIETVVDDITAHWPVLKEVGFEKLDIAILKPFTEAAEAWFFSGVSYAYVDLKNSKDLGGGAMSISEKWASLRQYNYYN